MNYDDVPHTPGSHKCDLEVFEYKHNGVEYRAILVSKECTTLHGSPKYVVEVLDGGWLSLNRVPDHVATLIHHHIRPMRKKIACLEAENAQLLARAK